jgi:hypothetical protein
MGLAEVMLILRALTTLLEAAHQLAPEGSSERSALQERIREFREHLASIRGAQLPAGPVGPAA